MVLFFHLRRNRRLATFGVVAAFAPLCVQLCVPPSLHGQITGGSTAPNYTSQSIVNAATQTVQDLAPNTIATIYGTNLAFSTRATTSTDLSGGSLPVLLDGVSVLMGTLQCGLLFISPTQINFVVPYSLSPGAVSLIVARQGAAGPSVTIQLDSTSPGLFLWNGNNAIAVHLNGVTISSASPALPGEVIVLYAAGLGKTSPDTTSGRLATAAASIVSLSQMQVLLNGTPTAPGSILYAGLTPGFSGLYQINLRLPSVLPPNPRIQVAIGLQVSPAATPAGSSVQLRTQ